MRGCPRPVLAGSSAASQQPQLILLESWGVSVKVGVRTGKMLPGNEGESERSCAAIPELVLSVLEQ